ncbi:response regulator transcription factor [Bacteroides sp. KG68]|uniref:response regulator transcription factor n=1 Tax=unclassified Bacteroides TaxID=2646097 RepID=UPI003D960A90|nr:helix-turn-helix transcriptional regulator [Bacteroides sp.]
MTPEIAIVDPNILSCLGLRTLLEEIIPTAVIRSFRSFGELMDDTPDMYVHYFISSQIYFEHTAFFLERKPRTIVLVNGEAGPQLPGMPTLNIYQDEKHLVKGILQLRQYGHPCKSQRKPALAGQPDDVPNITGDEHELSAREIEVLVLVVRGLINKEIADKLNISLTTVISHRKNITEKLGIKSVSGLTIYAVMHGYIEVDRI